MSTGYGYNYGEDYGIAEGDRVPLDPADLPSDRGFWLVDGLPCHLHGEQPRPQPGEAETYEFRFLDDPNGDVVIDHVQDYLDLRDRAMHAGAVHIETTIDDSVVWTNTARSRDNADPLVRIEPGPYDPTGTPIWGLITGIEDATTLSESIAALSLDVAYVAPRDDYADKAAVRAAHEHRGFY